MEQIMFFNLQYENLVSNRDYLSITLNIRNEIRKKS